MFISYYRPLPYVQTWDRNVLLHVNAHYLKIHCHHLLLQCNCDWFVTCTYLGLKCPTSCYRKYHLLLQCDCDTHLCNSQSKEEISKVTILTIIMMTMMTRIMMISKVISKVTILTMIMMKASLMVNMFFWRILYWINVFSKHLTVVLDNVPINTFKEKLSLECLLKFLCFSCSSLSHLCSSSAFFCTETFHWYAWEMFDMSSFKYFKPTKY